jgi:hypothetical protein
LIRRVALFRHPNYEELCALAATGQLGGSQMCELNEHIRTCKRCLKFFEAVVQLSAQTVPLLAAASDRVPQGAPPEGLRARFLSRLALEESKPRVLGPVPLQRQSKPSRASSGDRTTEPVNREGSIVSALLGKSSFAIVTTGVLCVVSGIFVGTWIKKPVVTPPVQTVRPTMAAEKHVDSSARIAILEGQNARFAAELESLGVELSTTRNERLALAEKLAEADRRLALASAPNASQDQHSTSSTAASDEVVIWRQESERLRTKLAESQAILAENERASDQLQAELESATDELRHAKDLSSAKAELGDVASARNLHIVDVYDADARGKRQPAFGRVFYVEGKSLVFYAYDLNTPKNLNANVVFHVWGGRAGVRDVTHSLGILRSDNASEGRWAMTFDDPGVLAQINSVFVTVEAKNRTFESPRGKKVLYAYLGSSPNHP